MAILLQFPARGTGAICSHLSQFAVAESPPLAGQRWLHASCARIARRLSLYLPEVSGGPDGSGLTVSNHLTYLDILVYGAVRPFVFVAKSEVRRWPLLGTLAKLGGTIFVDRGRSLQVAEASRQIEQGLRDGLPVLLFPEGTSSDGRSGPALSIAAL